MRAVELPDGRQLLMYTGVVSGPKLLDKTSKDTQTQCLAAGDGVDYEKYGGNPVLTAADLPEGGSPFDFRDPKMWRGSDRRVIRLVLPEPDGELFVDMLRVAGAQCNGHIHFSALDAVPGLF